LRRPTLDTRVKNCRPLQRAWKKRATKWGRKEVGFPYELFEKKMKIPPHCEKIEGVKKKKTYKAYRNRENCTIPKKTTILGGNAHGSQKTGKSQYTKSRKANRQKLTERTQGKNQSRGVKMKFAPQYKEEKEAQEEKGGQL